MVPIAWSQNLTGERALECGAVRVVKDELFERADFLTIHLVLSERTRGIVGAPQLARMKPTAYVVNTSRGPIVDNTALIEALRAGTIAGAALDVFDREPLAPDDPLLAAPHTLLSPHLGYVTQGHYAGYFPDIVEDIKAWRSGKPIRVLS
jgi:phosphoglycerate dehydrogenase-like enzyme